MQCKDASVYVVVVGGWHGDGCHGDNCPLSLFVLKVLEVLVRQYSQLASPDFISICQVRECDFLARVVSLCSFFCLTSFLISTKCYIFLDDAPSTAAVLEKLSRGSLVSVFYYQVFIDIFLSIFFVSLSLSLDRSIA